MAKTFEDWRDWIADGDPKYETEQRQAWNEAYEAGHAAGKAEGVAEERERCLAVIDGYLEENVQIAGATPEAKVRTLNRIRREIAQEPSEILVGAGWPIPGAHGEEPK